MVRADARGAYVAYARTLQVPHLRPQLRCPMGCRPHGGARADLDPARAARRQARGVIKKARSNRRAPEAIENDERASWRGLPGWATWFQRLPSGELSMATIAQEIRGRLVAIVVLGMAIGLVLFLSSNWTT